MNNNELLGKGYLGIIDAGIGLNAVQIRNLSLGIQINTSILTLSVTDLIATGVTPKITVSYDFRPANVSFIPQVAFGYSFWNFKAGSFRRNDNGLTFEGSLKMVFRRTGKVNFFLEGAYQYTRLGKPTEGEMDSDFNRNISTIYPGIGLIWKIK